MKKEAERERAEVGGEGPRAEAGGAREAPTGMQRCQLGRWCGRGCYRDPGAATRVDRDCDNQPPPGSRPPREPPPPEPPPGSLPPGASPPGSLPPGSHRSRLLAAAGLGDERSPWAWLTPTSTGMSGLRSVTAFLSGCPPAHTPPAPAHQPGDPSLLTQVQPRPRPRAPGSPQAVWFRACGSCPGGGGGASGGPVASLGLSFLVCETRGSSHGLFFYFLVLASCCV